MDGHTTLKYLQDFIWHKDYGYTETLNDETLFHLMLKLTEEVGELSRAVFKKARYNDPDNIRGTIDEELYDILYYTFCLAGFYGIDMETTVERKEALNAARYPSPLVFEKDR